VKRHDYFVGCATAVGLCLLSLALLLYFGGCT